MDPKTRNFLLLLAGTAAVPFIAQSAFADTEQRHLALDAANLGLIGTLIGVPLILFMSPRFSHVTTAVTLTAVGLGLKLWLLSHDEHEGALTPEEASLLTAGAAA